MHNFLGLGIGIGRFILILIIVYFTVKWAVKKGIEEYYEENKKKKSEVTQITICRGDIEMKKQNIFKFLYAVSIFLIIAFAIRLGVDYFKYETYNNSVPFYVFIIERVIEFIMPSIITFIIAKVVKKKYNK